jgi:hypothetical protein
VSRPALHIICLRSVLTLLTLLALGIQVIPAAAAVTLKSISLSPATVTLALAATQQYIATGTYSDGTTANITPSVTWTSSNSSKVSVSSSGLATVLAAAQNVINIRAKSGIITSPVAMVTTPPVLISISLSPATVALALNATQQYTATAKYSNGTTANITSSVTWTTSNAARVTISSTGLATVISGAINTINIRAKSGTVTSTVGAITVPPLLTAIRLSPLSVTLPLNGTQQYTATATYSNGTTATLTSPLTWVSSAASVVSVSSTGLAQVLGTNVRSATIRASSGNVTSPAATIAIAGTLTSIAITPASVTLPLNGTQQYVATGKYSNGTTANLSALATWSSSAPTVVSISAAGLAKVLSSNSAAVSVSASYGSVNSNVSLITVPPVLTFIAITPASISVGLGAQQQYAATGTYSDGTTQNVSSTVTWISANPSLVSVTAGGLAQVLGTSTTAIGITATSGTITSNIAYVNALASLPRSCPTPTIDMKLLVVTNGQTEADLPAILQILKYVGVPYTLFDFNATPGGITPAFLSDSICHGYYQGVIFAIGGYIYTLPGMATLTSYEQTFHVRQVNWYAYPGTDFGFQAPTASIPSTSPYQGTYTSAGVAVFPYLNTSTPLQIASASVYLALPNTPPAGTTVTPFVVDSAGNALSLDYNFGDGREYLTQTFDSNPYLTHDLVLAYGLLNWVTQGVYLGQYHVYAAAQVDDFFINDSEWIPGTPCTDPVTNDRTPPDSSTLPTFRLKAADMASLVAWQNGIQSDPLLSTFKLTLAFNGVGTTGNTDWTGLATPGAANDDLTANVQSYQQYFHWITHTFDHPGTLNGLHKSDVNGDPDTPKVDSIDLEILTNQYVANGSGLNLDVDSSDVITTIGLTDFNPANAVTPGVTGLNDVNVPTYLFQDGIQYVVSDSSVANITNPPNNNGANP